MASGAEGPNCPVSDPAAPPQHSNGHASPLDLLRRFHKVQQDRVKGYTLFDEAFNTFLQEAPNYDFETYKQKVGEITLSFKRISEEVIHIKNSLRDSHGQAALAGLMEALQELEERKLKHTADYQIARKNVEDEPNDEESKQQVHCLKNRLDELAQEISDVLEDVKYESEDLYAQEISDDSFS